MTAEEKQALGRQRMAAIRAEHGAAVEIQMAMGLTSGMLQLQLDPRELRATKLYQLIGAMGETEWLIGVKLTAAVLSDA